MHPLSRIALVCIILYEGDVFTGHVVNTGRHGHKLDENYGVFCNQFEVINFNPSANVTTCNVRTTNVLSFIPTFQTKMREETRFYGEIPIGGERLISIEYPLKEIKKKSIDWVEIRTPFSFNSNSITFTFSA